MDSKKERPTNSKTGHDVMKLHVLEHGEPELSVQDVKMKPTERVNTKNCPPPSLTSLLSGIMQIKVEIIMFLVIFSTMAKRISTTTMIIDKVCQVHLDLPPELCQNFSNYTDIKIEVERLSNNYSLAHFLLGNLPVAILACFIGVWSDKYGRRIPILICLIGSLAEDVGSVLCAAVFNSRVEFFLITPLLASFTGGFTGLLTLLYSYTSDISTSAKRTTKYAILEVAIGLSTPIGQFTGGALYKYSGYVAVFLVSTATDILVLVWAVSVLKETKGLDNTDSWLVKFKNFWSLQAAVDSFKETIKQRPNKGREKILLLILCRGIIILTYTAAGSVIVMYVHYLYDWGNTEVSLISAIFGVLGTVTMLTSVLLLKKYKVGDPVIGLIGVASLIVNFIATGLASRKEIFYFAHAMGLLGGLGTLACRSGISKVPAKDDLGKVFSFLTIAESLIPMIAVAIATQVFNATVHIYAGILFLSVSVFMLIPTGVFIWLARLPPVHEEEEEDTNTKQEEIFEINPCEEPNKN